MNAAAARVVRPGVIAPSTTSTVKPLAVAELLDRRDALVDRVVAEAAGLGEHEHVGERVGRLLDGHVPAMLAAWIEHTNV